MKKTELASEFSCILRLLREHAFLRYSSAGRQEYEQRLMAASTMFSELVSRATGLMVPPPEHYAELDTVSDGSYDGLVSTVRRVVARLRREPAALTAQDARRLGIMYNAWKRAAIVLANPRG